MEVSQRQVTIRCRVKIPHTYMEGLQRPKSQVPGLKHWRGRFMRYTRSIQQGKRNNQKVAFQKEEDPQCHRHSQFHDKPF